MQCLMAVVVQTQDAYKAEKALSKLNLDVTELASSGAFLSHKNTTLLVGLRGDQVKDAIKSIQKSCKQRVEYISTPLESAPLPIPVATPVTVGGAIVFVFEVEHFEEF